MLTLLHISDIHFGPPYVPRVGEALLKIAPALSPDMIIVSGDLTQRAKPEQFQQAKEFLARLPEAPQVVIPGNHDVPLYRVWERATDPLGEYRRYFDGCLNSVTQIDGVFVVALDSTAPRTALVNGRISREQLEFCRRSFEQAPEGAFRIVVAHHHFAPAPDYEKDKIMPRAKRAMECFQELDVDMIMGGHLHRAYIGNSLDIYPGVDRARGIIIVQSGTTTSRRGRAREREKNSFNLIHFEDEMLRVTHYMYFDEHDGFAPMSQHFFPRPGRRFVEPNDYRQAAPQPSS